MADLNHSTLVDDSKIHQPKGASTASSDTWMRANGDGTTTFTALPTHSITVDDSITGASFTDQELSANGSETQLSFGAAQTSANGAITIAANGEVTINEDGVYDIVISRNAGRTNNAGVNSVAFSTRINGTQAASSTIISLDNADAGTTMGNSVTGVAELPAGTTISHHMLYAAGNSGSVGVYTAALAPAGWEDVPSARISVTKLGIA